MECFIGFSATNKGDNLTCAIIYDNRAHVTIIARKKLNTRNKFHISVHPCIIRYFNYFSELVC